MFEISLVESLVSFLLDSLSKKILTQPEDRKNIDFVYKDEDDKIIGIEVKGGKVNLSRIKKILENITTDKFKLDKFFLVTQNHPSESDFHEFLKLSRNYVAEANWLTVEKLFNLFGLDLKSSNDINKLQLAAITSKINNYDKSNIGLKPSSKSKAQQLLEMMHEIEGEGVPTDRMIIDLGRQFPYSTLAKIKGCRNDSDIVEYFKIGKRSEDAIVVLSDIKNFSGIVAAAQADDLNEMMNKYYTESRNLVFKYNGVLDKFIGDAVLAIFNYPDKCDDSCANAIKFSQDLISLGINVFSELQSNMDNIVETGTRIGVSMGSIYTLNIGDKTIEVTFVSEKINLAARLEKNCEVNGILISNIFKTKLEKVNYSFFESLSIEEKIINKNDAKGQMLDIRTWQIKDIVF